MISDKNSVQNRVRQFRYQRRYGQREPPKVNYLFFIFHNIKTIYNGRVRNNHPRRQNLI